MATGKEQGNTANRELVFHRLIKAPRELVFAAWTQEEHLAKWYGPDGFTFTTLEHTGVKTGGRWRFIFHGPDGTDYSNRIEYTEVVKNKKLAYGHGSDVDDDNERFYVTLTFDTVGHNTSLTMKMVFNSPEQLKMIVERAGAIEGNRQTMNKLEKHLATVYNTADSTKPLIITRVFDAPVELVFKVFSTAEHLAHWWGPKGFGMLVKSLDFRPGGMFHYSMKTPDGQEMWGRFIYREIIAPNKIVFINSFSDKDGGITRAPFNTNWPLEVFNTLTLEDEKGKTKLTLQGNPLNATAEEQKAFDEFTASMQAGFKGTFDQLEQYLEQVK